MPYQRAGAECPPAFGAADPLLGCPSCGKLNIIAGSAGGVPERLKGADCKSVGLAPTLVRIQPPPPDTRAKGRAKLQQSAAESLGERNSLRRTDRRREGPDRSKTVQTYNNGARP